MHEHATLEMVDYKLSRMSDRSRVTRIVISELEVHDPGRFRKTLSEFLRKRYPEVNARIEIVSPLVSKGIRIEC